VGLPPHRGRARHHRYVIAASSVWAILIRRSIAPSPRRSGLTLAEFLATQAKGLMACELRRRHHFSPQAPRARVRPPRQPPRADRRHHVEPDRILIIGRRHLEAVLAEYLQHYSAYRPHRTLGQRAPSALEMARRSTAKSITPHFEEPSGWAESSTSTAWSPEVGGRVLGTHRSAIVDARVAGEALVVAQQLPAKLTSGG
jgi:hypothetical protein